MFSLQHTLPQGEDSNDAQASPPEIPVAWDQQWQLEYFAFRDLPFEIRRMVFVEYLVHPGNMVVLSRR